VSRVGTGESGSRVSFEERFLLVVRRVTYICIYHLYILPIYIYIYIHVGNIYIYVCM
jgi:hypothetical protein